MAVCEVCGKEQTPFDCLRAPGKDHRWHWFCSVEHLTQYREEERVPKEADLPSNDQLSVEEIIVDIEGSPAGAGAVLQAHKDDNEGNEDGILVTEKAASKAASTLAKKPKRSYKRKTAT